MDGRARVRRQARRRAQTADVRRPAAGEGDGRGARVAYGGAAKPQSSVVRLWLVLLKLDQQMGQFPNYFMKN